MLASRTYEIFKRISREDMHCMGFSYEFSRPDWMVLRSSYYLFGVLVYFRFLEHFFSLHMAVTLLLQILTVLPVPPLAVRPLMNMRGGAKSQDDLTYQLNVVLRLNEEIRQIMVDFIACFVIIEMSS